MILWQYPSSLLMTCNLCHAENAEGSFSCSQCGSAFASSPGTSSSFDADVTAPALALGPQKLSSGASWVSPGLTANLEPDSDFGPRYRIEAVLGRGGMGAVYKAYDKDLDRIVALKLVRPGLTTDPEVMQRFRQELLLASKVSHKNILRIHDLGDVNGVKFISMAYVEGEDLAHTLKAQGHWPAAKAVELARQLSAALAAAHAEGVVHRDLKPQNILIDHAGNAYISDFGLAKSLEAGAAMMTHTGQILGTPRYMSPEQVEGKPADHRSDLYAMGLILYETVTGNVPFTGESTLQVMYQRLRDDPVNPKVLHPELPNHLVRIILRCLERDPERRYQSAQEILDDLDASGAHLSLRNLAVSIRHPKRKSVWAIAALAVLALVVSITVPRIRNFFLHRGATAGSTRGSPGIPALARGKYIAVLPFRVLGDTSSLGYVGEGLQDALAAKLFQLQGVHLLSAEVSHSERSPATLDAVARELNANLILEGTIQEGGGRIAIVANLHDMTSGALLWSQEFTGVPGDLLTLEDEIYSQLVTVLKVSPSNQELVLATRHPTENLEAYDLYLKGRDAMRGQQDPKNVETAINYYNQALQKDSGFALAYAGLADASRLMYFAKRDHVWAEKALEAAQQAQRLDDNLPEVHFSLGSVYDATGKTAEAIAELRRALDLAPNSDDAYRRLGSAYMSAGRKNEAIRAFEKAVDLNPYYWYNYRMLGEAYFRTGDNEKALAAWQKIIQLEPDNVMGYEDVGAVYLSEGKYNECIPMFQKALQLRPTADNFSNLGTAYFYLKRYDDAVQMFSKAIEMNPNKESLVGNLGDAYRWSGQKDKANAAYDRAISLAVKDLQVNPRDAGALESIALYYAKEGQSGWAREYILKARAIDPSNVEYVYSEAVVEALAGRQQDALKALHEALEKGYSADQARNDPELKNLQGNPEFDKLLTRTTGKPG
jgi:eukaryotic-like serine/threonine-protein kinase